MRLSIMTTDTYQGAALTILQLTTIAQSSLLLIVAILTCLSLSLRANLNRLLRFVLQRLVEANRRYGHREPDSTANRTGQTLHPGRKIAASSEKESRRFRHSEDCSLHNIRSVRIRRLCHRGGFYKVTDNFCLQLYRPNLLYTKNPDWHSSDTQRPI